MSEEPEEPNNATRRDRANRLRAHYAEIKMEVNDEDETELSDMLADMFHLAVSESKDDTEEVCDRIVRVARMHFDAEHNNPEEEPTNKE